MKVCPYISLPYRPQVPGRRLWLYALRSALVQTPVADTQGRCVDLAPWPLQVHPSGFVEFVDNGRPEYERMRRRRVRPDLVVLCTGYQQSFPFLDQQSNPPYATPDTADVRRIWKRSDPSVGFIGFVRPSLGAIPPLSEMQAQLWIVHLLARHRIPRPLHSEDEWHYSLRSVPGARLPHGVGVDQESYAYQLALDMNAAPGFVDVVGFRSLKLLLVWGLGANFNTKFRLCGPWRWDGAPVVLSSDEIWATITRRPILFGKCCGALRRVDTNVRRSLCSLYLAYADIRANQFDVFLARVDVSRLSGDERLEYKLRRMLRAGEVVRPARLVLAGRRHDAAATRGL